MQDGQRVGFVVVTRAVTTLPNCQDHLVLACVTFTCRVLLDRPHRYALVRNVVTFAPSREVAHKAAISVRGVHPSVATDFFEVHRIDVVRGSEHFSQPALEAQEAHSATFKALRLELLGATRDRPVCVQQRPASTGAQIEGQNLRIHLLLHFWGE